MKVSTTIYEKKIHSALFSVNLCGNYQIVPIIKKLDSHEHFQIAGVDHNKDHIGNKTEHQHQSSIVSTPRTSLLPIRFPILPHNFIKNNKFNGR